MKRTVYEVEHPDFIGDGSKDHLIYWVSAESMSDVIAACGVPCKVEAMDHVEADDAAVDFHLPADRAAIAKAVQP